MEIYRDPVKMVDGISALGLRHAGYGIPTEQLFRTFSDMVWAAVAMYVFIKGKTFLVFILF